MFKACSKSSSSIPTEQDWEEQLQEFNCVESICISSTTELQTLYYSYFTEQFYLDQVWSMLKDIIMGGAGDVELSLAYITSVLQENSAGEFKDTKILVLKFA